jgi:hypothetical protein
VVLASQGQLRLAPSGHVVGMDMDAALTLAAARGHDLAVLSELGRGIVLRRGSAQSGMRQHH